MGSSIIDHNITEGVATVVINNPPVNSLTGTLLQRLGERIDELGSDSHVKVIIVTGTGKTFATGADINEMGGVKSAEEASAISTKGQDAFLRIEKCPKPVIAAINGFCLGGGLELALCCHIRFASDNSIFGMPEIHIGLMPAFGGSYRLPAIVGTGKALQMVFTAQKINCTEAHSLRLVNSIFPADELMDEVRKTALQMARFSSATMRMTLETVLNARFNNLEKTMQAESEAVGKLYDMNDLKEGVYAWLEKRKPEFKDL